MIGLASVGSYFATLGTIFMPPFEKGGHIALHLSVGMSVGRYVGRYVGRSVGMSVCR